MNQVKTKRAVSVVISVLLILAITTVGAVFVSNLIQASSITTVSQTPQSKIIVDSIRLTSYDTRDSTTLSAIPSLNNKLDDELCTDRCKAFSDNIPTSVLGGGTDFIVVQIRNKNVNSITIHDVQINEILHNWDRQTSGVLLDASGDDISGKYPSAGKFSVVPISNDSPLIQRSSPELKNDEEVRLVIKLSSDIKPDIQLGEPIQILVNFGSNQPVEYIILTGDTK